ncbi:hypothetical protein AXH09_13750 [Pseudomonas aeruginosa]|nr:hypothetical protein AXH09_13750 [Pseudomonas aeruginosa]
MNENNSEVGYRVSFALIDEEGIRHGVALPNAMHLLFERNRQPLLPRIGESLTLMSDLVDSMRAAIALSILSMASAPIMDRC